jgi:hypothetical protein
MSIPLDNLYHYIEHLAEQINQDRVVIYRFFPHGSKKQEDLNTLKFYPFFDPVTSPGIICHDQEPLNFELYESSYDTLPEKVLTQWCSNETNLTRKDKVYLIYKQIFFKRYNLRYYPVNLYDHAILLHSELRSPEVIKYSNNNFIPLYYWSHALIALDWFRFANYINQKKQVTKTFLIYNRAWSGTREYRLKFAELLVRLGLQDYCKTSINPIEPELDIHYDLHKFKNPVWRPSTVLENFFPVSTAHSHYSASFELEDYETTDIEIVLETLFDDQRLHLTEKSLRPIACAQPFILAGTHGSLEYLRSYGFKTFDHIWNEHYDLVEDPKERLISIADLMKQITNWAPDIRERKMAEAKTIADYNRQHFFSKEFNQLIKKELADNLSKGLSDIETKNTGQVFIDRRKTILKNPKMRQLMITDKNEKENQRRRKEMAQWLKQARTYKKNNNTPSQS